MPTITVTREMLEALGISSADLHEPILTGHAKRSLEGALTAHGFDVTRDIGLVVLASGEGVVLTQ
jgi:hypothetical protein